MKPIAISCQGFQISENAQRSVVSEYIEALVLPPTTWYTTDPQNN